MTSSNNGDAAKDEEVARALQERYYNLLSSGVGGSAPTATAAPPARSKSSSGGGSGSKRTRSSKAAVTSGSGSGSAPTARSKSDSTSYRTPKHKKSNSSNSSPDTATTAGSTPSPEAKSSRAQRQGSRSGSAQPKSSTRPSSRSSPRGSPRSSPRSSPKPSPRSSPRGSPSSSLRKGFSLDMFVDTSSDEEVARRLEQELRDAELASRLASHERASSDFAVDSIPVGNIAALPSRLDSRASSRDTFVESPERRGKGSSSPDDCRAKTIHYSLRIILSLLVAGITFVIFVAVFGRHTNDALDPSGWVPGYPEMDPSLGSVGEHNKWKPINGQATGRGLTLTVLNNLVSGSDWNEYLRTSIAEWNDGEPDAVTLNVRAMAHDPDCRAVRRAMKVCNANYGPTDWRGVNQILLQDEYIITSLAKMNDYYLEGTNRAQKQYTICHELGHGLGLGHSDENFHNADLGNCMDYTERPENNMHPDRSNFETLEELYGNVNGNVRVEKLEVHGDGRRATEEEERMLQEEFDRYAAYLSEPIESTHGMLEGEDVSPHIDSEGDDVGSWRLLHRSEYAVHHERRLGNGYLIRTSILLA